MDLAQIISEIYEDSVQYSTTDSNVYDLIQIIKAPEGFILPSEQGLRDLESEASNISAKRQLRTDRNHRLTDTDWWGVSDQIMTDAQKTYRQELRDLPSIASPKLGENNRLTGITWPIKP